MSEAEDKPSVQAFSFCCRGSAGYLLSPFLLSLPRFQDDFLGEATFALPAGGWEGLQAVELKNGDAGAGTVHVAAGAPSILKALPNVAPLSAYGLRRAVDSKPYAELEEKRRRGLF